MDRQLINSILDDALSLINQGNADQALPYIEPLTQSYDSQIAGGSYRPTDIAVFYDFADPISGNLFLRMKKEARIVYPTTEPMARLYSLLGQCYLLVGRAEEAFDALKKALEWDPASPQLYFLLAQACEALGDMKSHDACIASSYPLITTVSDLAYFQHLRGVQMIQQGEVDRGIANLLTSLHWKETDATKAALARIAEQFGPDRIDLDQATVVGMMVAAGDPILPLEETSQALIDFAAEAIARGDYVYARGCVSRVLAYAPDDDLRQTDKNLQQLIANQTTSQQGQ